VRPARARVLAPLLVLAIALPACGGGDDDAGSSGTEQDPVALEGASWVLTQMLTAGRQTEIVGVGVNAEFDGSSISGNSGCNRYNASYQASGSQISFGPIAGTKMQCGEPASSTETRYLQLLEGVASYEVSGRSMSMSDGDGTPVLQFMKG
jgi:heat shock protein HslJ